MVIFHCYVSSPEGIDLIAVIAMLICINSPNCNPRVIFQMEMSGPKMGPPSFGEGHGERFGGNSG